VVSSDYSVLPAVSIVSPSMFHEGSEYSIELKVSTQASFAADALESSALPRRGWVVCVLVGARSEDATALLEAMQSLSLIHI